jgi:hypothetical protein
LAAANDIWNNLTPSSVGQRDMTKTTETARRHAIETQRHDLATVQAMEKKMEISI